MTTTWLTYDQWTEEHDTHRERARGLTATFRAAQERGERHEIEEFLFSYYPIRPRRLERWSAGVGVGLWVPEGVGCGDARAEVDRVADARWMRVVEGPDGVGVELDVAAFVKDRGATVRFVRSLLAQTDGRAPQLGCFGLHEWAMVYRSVEPRHGLPLRLGEQGTNDVVDAQRLRCTHVDAFRFFTPAAVPRNRWQPTREAQPALEQPGCLHANMDLYKWAWKLQPAVPGGLLLDCFELARDIRYLDMQASPYDVSRFGLPAVMVETAGGRAEYARRQKEFAERSQPLRRRLIEVCDEVLARAEAAAGLCVA